MTWRSITESFEKRREALLSDPRAAGARLPLRQFRQSAHFTTPASDFAMLEKAIGSGIDTARRILERQEITPEAVGNALSLPASEIKALFTESPRPPLVMVDGEDAQALQDEVVERGRKNAVRIFREGEWGDTLRYYRPSGLGLRYCVQDLVEVLSRAGEGRRADQYPIDGVIFPKLDRPEQMQWVCDLLARIESELKLPPQRIRLQFLVESGWALMNLPQLVEASLPRLSGIIFGIADYSAAIQLPEIKNEHPACDLARMHVVVAAASAGVPAIDNMTVNYPVAVAAGDPESRKRHLLSRIREAFDDARHGEALGMDGKWVGHPLQLLAVLLAYRTARSRDEIEAEVAKLEAYSQAVARELGATMIAGVMSDRATDRHARLKLRKATALGHLDPNRAAAIGVITEDEARALSPLSPHARKESA